MATAVVAYGGILVLTAVYARLPGGWAHAVLLLPLFVLLSRLYQGAHHLTDVLTSVVYASVWMLVVARLVLVPDPRRADSSGYPWRLPAMLTIQAMPNLSWHMPNSSPHICFSSGTGTVPPRGQLLPVAAQLARRRRSG